MSGSPQQSSQLQAEGWKAVYDALRQERDDLIAEKGELRARLSQTEQDRDDFRKRYTDLQLQGLLSAHDQPAAAAEQVHRPLINSPILKILMGR